MRMEMIWATFTGKKNQMTLFVEKKLQSISKL